MTNAIEGTKLNMYDMLGVIKTQTAHKKSMEVFESNLEAHLEELRKAADQNCTDLANMNSVLTDAYQQQRELTRAATKEAHGLDDELVGVQAQLGRVTEERDALRNRVQALEFANQAAGDELRAKADENLAHRKQIVSLLEERSDVMRLHAEGQKRNHQEKISALTDQMSGAFLMVGCLPVSAFGAKCQHEFHPKFPAGEMCTYCGVVK